MKELANTIPAVSKTIAILEYLGSDKSNSGITQLELAKELKISPSSCYRILQSLQAANWICRNNQGRYTISNGIFKAVQNILDQNSRFEKYQTVINKLAQLCELSCKLSIRRGYQQVTILRGESPNEISVSGKIGASFPLIEGSVGAVLLANETIDNIKEIINVSKEDIAEKNNPNLLFERIKYFRKHGYTLTLEHENRWRICAMSLPLLDNANNIIASITLLGLKDDFAENKLEKLKNIVMEQIKNIK